MGAIGFRVEQQVPRNADCVVERDAKLATPLALRQGHLSHLVVYQKRREEALDSSLTFVGLPLGRDADDSTVLEAGDQLINSPPVLQRPLHALQQRRSQLTVCG